MQGYSTFQVVEILLFTIFSSIGVILFYALIGALFGRILGQAIQEIFTKKEEKPTIIV